MQAERPILDFSTLKIGFPAAMIPLYLLVVSRCGAPAMAAAKQHRLASAMSEHFAEQV